MLSQEIQNGTLHTVNWDTKALVSMPSLVPPPAETKNATIQSTPRVIATGWAAARTTPLLTTTSGNDREPIASPQFSASTCAMSNSGAKNSGTSSSGDGGGYHNSAYNNNTGTRHSRVRRGSSSKDDESGNYYGPSAGNDEIEAQAFAKNTNKDSYDTVVDSSSHHGLRDQSKKHFNNKRKDRSVDSTSNDSYYGPSQPNTLSFDGNCLDEFVPVPSYNKSIVNKKSKKNGHAGFNQTNAVLSNRANRFSGKGGVSDVAALTTEYSSKSEQGEWDRYMGKKTIGGTNKKLDEADYENMTIRGTCQTLEKSYLRLTAPPRAELVRPQAVLDQHLQNLRREWEKKSHYYLWFCSQLKAVRQDCTVQRIQNAFAVDVYEMHAKIALEEDDLNEYNQCQTQLKELYAFISKQENDDESSRTALRNSNEFLAYRLVYFVFLAMESQKYDSGSSDMFKVMLSLSHQQHQDPLIKHALAVREACCSGILDYHAFFRLHRECASGSSNVSKSQLIYLLDRIVPAMRYNALLVMCKGYKPSTVEVNFLLKELGFDTGSKSKKEDGRTWLISCGCVLSDDGMELQTKDTVVHESVGELKQSLI